MQHFTKSQMQSARKANLYDYLMCNHLSDCIKDGNSLRPKCNHSISIKQGYAGYKDFSSDETGNSVDFLVRYMGYDLDMAVIALSGQVAPVLIAGAERKKEIEYSCAGGVSEAIRGALEAVICLSASSWYISRYYKFIDTAKNYLSRTK